MVPEQQFPQAGNDMAKYTFLCRNCLTEIVASREDIRTKGTCPRCGCSYTVPTAEDEYVYTELLRHHGINPLSVSQNPPEYVRQLIESYGIPVPALDNLEPTVKPVALPRPMDPGRAAMILNFIGALFINHP